MDEKNKGQIMKIGDKVQIVLLPDNVADDVMACLNAVGTIKCGGSPYNGIKGWYVHFDNELPTKRFYENELEVV